MSDGRMLKLLLVAVVILALPGCVSKSTFEEMAGQAKRLDTDLTDLQGLHQALQAQQIGLQAKYAALQAEHEALAGEKSRLEKDKTDLLAQKEALAASNRELEGILAAKEDSLSKKIAEQRQELASQQADYTGRLAAQSRQIGEREQKIIDLAGKIAFLDDQLRQKSARIDEQEKKIAALDKQLAEKEQQLAQTKENTDRLGEDLRLLKEQKENEVREVSSTYQALLGKMKSEIDKGQITISELKGKLTVNLIDAILFDSGKAEVKPDGLLVLQKVIDILKGVSGKTIRIEGHTDNVQIIGGLAQKYPTNWELSAARAVNVARFLQERGIDPLTLNAVAYGEYKPVADNSSEAGRARNRRIEIVLVNRE